MEEIESLRNLLRHINQGVSKVDINGLNGAARPFLASLLFERLERPLLIVCPEEKEAADASSILSFFIRFLRI